MSERGPRDPFFRRTAIYIPVAVIGLLSLPMALTSRSFGTDWTLHLWLVRQQQFNIEAMGHPGLFLSARPLGAFYPIFAFVGSGIYSVGGYLAIALGDRPITAYKLLYVIGLCLGYGGMTWLSVQRGLRGWRSQIPGLVVVTGAYFITDLGGRGDLGEFMGLASIPLLLAATYSVLSTARLRVRQLLAVVVAVFVLTGSHNITLLWGTIFVTLCAVVMLVAYGPRLRRPLPWARVGGLLGCALIGAGLNAWYLFPDLAYGLDTSIAKANHGKLPAIVDGYGFLLGALRPPTGIRVTIPFLFVGWAVLVAVVSWRQKNGALKRLFVGVLLLGSVYAVFTAARSPWRWLPAEFYNVQFTRRLNAYILIATALLVMIALEWHAQLRGRLMRVATVALAFICVFTVGISIWQLVRKPSYYHTVGGGAIATDKHFNDLVVRSRFVIPPSWYSRDDFREVTTKFVATPEARALTIPLHEIHGSHFTGVLKVPQGSAPFRTNISAGPRFVRMTGIQAVGRTSRGFIVAVRSASAPPTGSITVTIDTTDSPLLRAGGITTFVSGLALIGLLAYPVGRRLVGVQPPPSDPVAAGDPTTGALAAT